MDTIMVVDAISLVQLVDAQYHFMIMVKENTTVTLYNENNRCLKPISLISLSTDCFFSIIEYCLSKFYRHMTAIFWLILSFSHPISHK